MSKVINRFRGEYAWASNLYSVKIEYEDLTYPSLENAYQAAKTYRLNRTKFLRCSSVQAKHLGKKVAIRKDWEDVKFFIMKDLIDIKFKEGSILARKLMATGDAEIVHDNYHGDVYWGKCKGIGKDMLGKLLMNRRTVLMELRK